MPELIDAQLQLHILLVRESTFMMMVIHTAIVSGPLFINFLQPEQRPQVVISWRLFRRSNVERGGGKGTKRGGIELDSNMDFLCRILRKIHSILSQSFNQISFTSTSANRGAEIITWGCLEGMLRLLQPRNDPASAETMLPDELTTIMLLTILIRENTSPRNCSLY